MDDLQLVGGTDACVDILGRNADPFGNVFGGTAVIPGHHEYPDARFPCNSNGFEHAFADGILHAEQAEPAVAGVGIEFSTVPIGEADHAQSAIRPCIERCLNPCTFVSRQIAHVEDNLRCTFQEITTFACDFVAGDCRDHVFRFGSEEFFGKARC